MSSSRLSSIVDDLEKSTDLSRASVERRRVQTERYHAAVVRGRHPRSFPRKNDLWRFLESAKQRQASAARGQRLSAIVNPAAVATKSPVNVNEFSQLHDVRSSTAGTEKGSVTNDSQVTEHLARVNSEPNVRIKAHQMRRRLSVHRRKASVGKKDSGKALPMIVARGEEEREGSKEGQAEKVLPPAAVLQKVREDMASRDQVRSRSSTARNSGLASRSSLHVGASEDAVEPAPVPAAVIAEDESTPEFSPIKSATVFFGS